MYPPIAAAARCTIVLLRFRAFQADAPIPGSDVNRRTAGANIKFQTPRPPVDIRRQWKVRLNAAHSGLRLNARRVLRRHCDIHTAVMRAEFHLPPVPDRASQLYVDP